MIQRVAHQLLRAQTAVVGTVGYALAPPAPPFEPDRVASILIVRLDEIGDVVLNTPVLRETRRRFPAAHITLVVNPSARDLMATCPHIDELLVFDPSARTVVRPAVVPYRALGFARRHLWSRRFDLALLPRFGADGAYATYLAFFSGARWRAGHAEASDVRRAMLNPGFDRLLTHAVSTTHVRHAIDHNLDVLRALGIEPRWSAPELWLTDHDDHVARDLLLQGGWRPGDSLIVMCPSAGHSRLKQWPLSRMAELTRRLYEAVRGRMALVGAPGEELFAREFRAAAPAAVIDLIGRTTLRQAAAVIRHARLFVGNDTGAMHIAGAVGTPVVALFGSSDHTRFGPAGVPHIVVRRDVPCHPVHRLDRPDRCVRCVHGQPLCLTQLDIGDVFDACTSLLASTAPLRSSG